VAVAVAVAVVVVAVVVVEPVVANLVEMMGRVVLVVELVSLDKEVVVLVGREEVPCHLAVHPVLRVQVVSVSHTVVEPGVP
jgi:hypothetical protein